MIIRIKPLTHKMKNRVRERGEWWRIATEKDGKHLLVVPPESDDNSWRYGAWLTEGKDFEILETKDV